LIPFHFSKEFYQIAFPASSIIIILGCFHSLFFLILPVVKMTFCKKKDYLSEIDDEINEDNIFTKSTNLMTRTSSALT
jgi:hypothetical protein